MLPSLFDSHCHLNATAFDDDRDALILRATERGVLGWLVPSVSSADWQLTLSLCQRHPHIYAAIGIHPWSVSAGELTALNRLQALIGQHTVKVKAIGETGLNRLKPRWDLQEQFFDAQLAIARENKLPVIIHSVKAHSDVLRHVKRYPGVTGVVHAFSGSLQEAMGFIDQGYKLGVGGVITYPRALKTHATFSQVPLSSLVLETDAPAMPVFGYQGRRNEPERLLDVFHALCRLRRESTQEVAAQLNGGVNALLSLTKP